MRAESVLLGFMGMITAIAVWFVLRLVVLWYFRIDRIVELLEQLTRQNKALMEQLVAATRQANGPQG